MKATLTLLTTLVFAPQVAKRLGFTACGDWPRMEVKAGETKTVTVTADGSIESVVSDASWKVADGPSLRNSL